MKMRRNLIIIAVNLFFLIAFLVCQGVSAWIAAPLHAGRAAVAWAGQSGERFAQLAVFFPQSFDFDDEAIYNTRKAIETSLREASLEVGEGHRFYADAWSAEGSAAVAGKRGSATASIIGVGGDFFLFHPLYLRNGSYILPGDVMRDRVVLDEQLAWRLYGSNQLAGLEVNIGGKPFVIAGVVARETDFASLKAYEGGAGLFMSYEAFEAMMGEETEEGARIGSYEIVMPDVVTGFALTSLTDALKDESLLIVDNTSRFGYANLFDLIGSFGERSMHPNGISFPYWENATRFAEDWLALLFFLSLVSMVCPAVCALIYGIKLLRFGFRKGKDAVRAKIRARENREYVRYLQRHDPRDAKQDTL